MKATLVSILPAEPAERAGRPALTPELLAASGARYSRNNEGLEAILERIDPADMDRSVDTIFRLIDYGHQSIADMAPVAIFIDGISIWLAYYVWSLCPVAGGQESSTRYIEMNPDAVVSPEMLGIPESRLPAWKRQMHEAFEAYAQALAHWEAIGNLHPELTAIPAAMLDTTEAKVQRAAERMKRNYRFDRARYYLPVAAATNMMMVMSARGWVRLCQHLCSHPLREAQQLGDRLREELALSAPRLLKHAVAQPGIAAGIRQELAALSARAADGLPHTLQPASTEAAAAPSASLEIQPPAGIASGLFADALRHHDNRYGWAGSLIQRTSVRCAWQAMAMAEIRDINRHRTGNRYCPLQPVGFYAALDQLPPAAPRSAPHAEAIRNLAKTGKTHSAMAHARIGDADHTGIYDTLLGTQYFFERVTTADKFLYEAELRTGLGAHYRYARHYKDALELWYARFPETRGLILEGNAEPE